jgi:hypothetical protein
MDGSRTKDSNSSAMIFLAGVVVGGVGGGIAGWLLGGHLAPLLTGIFNLITRDENKRQTVRFEALQQ